MAVAYHTGGFPPDKLDWNSLIPLLGPTSAAIARYDGILAAIPNPKLLLSPLTSQVCRNFSFVLAHTPSTHTE